MGVTHGKLGILYKWNGTATNLSAEACTVSTNDAQITDTTKRILNPNCSNLVFTPTNSVNCIGIDHANGVAHFDGAPGVTTCAGTGACVLAANLVKTGYLYEWSLDMAIEAHDLTAFQNKWKVFGGGLAEASGQVQGFMVGSNWWDDFEDETDGTKDIWFLELFTYDPDEDRTGDHYDCWVIMTGFGAGVPVGDYVKETVPFQVLGYPVFTANA